MRRYLRVAVLAVAVLTTAALASTAHAAPAPQRPAPPPPLAGRIVAIDPGHQLGNARHLRQINRPVWVGLRKPCNTTGTATNAGYPEATFAWQVSLALRDRLQALGATVRLTRTANSLRLWGPCVDVRGEFGARVHADVAVSVHGDGAAPATHGFFVIRPGLLRGYTDDILASSQRLAVAVHGGLVRVGVRPSTAYGGDGYDVRRDLGTLNMADVPSVLVELGNMRNAGDARCMTHARCRDGYAAGLAAGVRDFLMR